ncbi:hypothetical protein QJS66_02175 [Kocuria rhizophila]|nr:hypothetical protein QJS66_02175 [Kocuria rhizophila]
MLLGPRSTAWEPPPGSHQYRATSFPQSRVLSATGRTRRRLDPERPPRTTRVPGIVSARPAHPFIGGAPS